MVNRSRFAHPGQRTGSQETSNIDNHPHQSADAPDFTHEAHTATLLPGDSSNNRG